tara:strand:+ start:1196 stop:1624 length:429 start_codon:yes stop_codon:yes gene_type:complete
MKAKFVNAFTRTGKPNANGKRVPLFDEAGEVIQSAKYILVVDENSVEDAEMLEAYRKANVSRWDTLVDAESGDVLWYPWSLIREATFNVTISKSGTVIPEATREAKMLQEGKSLGKGVHRQMEKLLAEQLLAKYGLGVKSEE